MPFKVGDVVTVTSFKRDGTVLEILKDRRYKVTLGNLPVILSEDQISLSTKKKQSSTTRAIKDFSIERHPDAITEKEEIDLHGFIVTDALVAVEAKLNRAILSNLHRIKLVHGLGSGRLKEAIHEYLGASPIVSAYKLDEWNLGVTWVYL